MGQKPREAPRNVPDSLPKRDEGTDVMPDKVRRTDRPRQPPPDSPPGKHGETLEPVSPDAA
jgi:hypothetical protein